MGSDPSDYVRTPDHLLLPREPCPECGRYVEVANRIDKDPTPTAFDGSTYVLYEYCIWCGWRRTIDKRGPGNPVRSL